jgi:hypothetical protein
MVDIPHWNELGSDGSWDRLVLGGQPVPGVATVECELSWKLDFQKPKGADGHKVKDEGFQGADVDIEIVLVSPEEIEAFGKLLPTIRPAKKGGKRQPLEIQHPSATVAGVATIAVEKIKINQPSARDGWTVRISAKEWLANPTANNPGGVLGSGGRSCAALAAQLQATHHQMTQTAAELQVAMSGIVPDFVRAKVLENRLRQQQAQVVQLERELARCSPGGGTRPPSSQATQTAAAA